MHLISSGIGLLLLAMANLTISEDQSALVDAYENGWNGERRVVEMIKDYSSAALIPRVGSDFKGDEIYDGFTFGRSEGIWRDVTNLLKNVSPGDVPQELHGVTIALGSIQDAQSLAFAVVCDVRNIEKPTNRFQGDYLKGFAALQEKTIQALREERDFVAFTSIVEAGLIARRDVSADCQEFEVFAGALERANVHHFIYPFSVPAGGLDEFDILVGEADLKVTEKCLFNRFRKGYLTTAARMRFLNLVRDVVSYFSRATRADPGRTWKRRHLLELFMARILKSDDYTAIMATVAAVSDSTRTWERSMLTGFEAIPQAVDDRLDLLLKLKCNWEDRGIIFHKKFEELRREGSLMEDAILRGFDR
ncbi:MAG: hypothetical protein AAFV88_05955 [Planctomycetota bacterium]